MDARKVLALIPVLVAFCVGSPRAHASAPSGLDQSFGTSGTTTVAVPETAPVEGIKAFTVTAGGRVYVLDGSLLLAFENNGEVAGDFGEDGRIAVTPAIGEGEGGYAGELDFNEPRAGPSGLAVDSLGRLLVAGSTYLKANKSYEAYVVRFLPDGQRDETFGEDGEVNTDFDLSGAAGHKSPSVQATSIVVDAQDRPVVGGSFGRLYEPCGLNPGGGPAPYVGRLTTSGAIDRTFAEMGRIVLGRRGAVFSIARNPVGGLAVFTRPCGSPPRIETQAPLFNALTDRGKVFASAKNLPLSLTREAPAIDPRGRIVEVVSPPEVVESADALVRLLPNGSPDPSFGGHGRVVMRRPSGAGALAVDAQGRPIVAVSTAKTELKRYLPNGKLEAGFGPGGRLKAEAPQPSAIALDAVGRIYTASMGYGSPQDTITVARFIPGN